MIRKYLEKIKHLFRRKVIIIIFGILILGISFFVWYGVNLYRKNFVDKEIDEFEVIEIDDEDKIEEEVVLVKEFYYVDVKGAVNSPGVYAIEVGGRVKDAIEVAGGVSSNADTSLINLAKVVFDEMVIVVYTKDEVIRSNTKFEINKDINDAYKEEVSVDNIKDNSDVSTNNLVNINTASLDELIELSGIGQSKAEAIISYREEVGLFTTIEDILNVSGIGNSVFEKIKDDITV